MNRKIFSIIFLWLWALGLMAQTDGYDPVSPPNPEVNLAHKLTTLVQPAKAGYANVPDSKYRKGSEVWIYTEGREHYKFKGWMAGDSVVSMERSFYYVMPDNDVVLTAVYEYDPESPENPYGKLGVLTLKASPSRGGYFNYGSNEKIKPGEELDLYAYSNQNYKFKHWEYEGQIVSETYDYHFTMSLKDAEFVAVFEYCPENPSNPGSNSWNAATGELIIDDFQPDNLLSAMYYATNGNYNEAQTLIVNGQMSDYDIGSIANRNFVEVDLSRCAGVSTIQSWSFSSNQSLETVSLPSSIKSIENYAFSDCIKLTTVNCFAAIPPIIYKYVFRNVRENITVFVPAKSVTLYQEAPGWEGINIQPLRSQVSSLQVNLPAGSEDGRFKNMFIELVNVNSGQRMRYVISERTAYTFQNLMHNTTWNVYVKNASDQVLGQIDNIQIQTEDVVKSFESLLEPQTIKASILKPDSEDVTDQVQMTWMSTDGAYIGQGASVTGVLPVDGAEVVLRVTLPKELAMEYQMLEDLTYQVKQAGNSISQTLIPLPKAQLTGAVKDAITGQALGGAIVTISQTINGKYTKSLLTTANEQGVFNVEAFDAPSTVTAAAPDHVSKTAVYESLTLDNGVVALDNINLKSINGATITVGFTYTKSAVKGAQGESQAFFGDYENVAYAIYDVTKDTEITAFNVQYPQIVLIDADDVVPGDILQLTATSKTGAFTPITTEGKVDELNRMSATFDIKQLGQISATFVSTENSTVNGILYDGEGKFVGKETYAEGAVLFTELTDGDYSLVTMGNSKLFNTIYDLSKFAESGLVEKTDYVISRISVRSGVISVVKLAFVPFFDESKLYYTGSNTSFAVNRAQATAGSYLTLSGRIDFKDVYSEGVSDLKLIVDLPATCTLVDNSVMVGNSTGDYMSESNRITIPFTTAGDRIRFCIVPTAGGNYAPSAYAQFTYNGQTVTQPIGQVTFSVKDLSINVPSTVAKAMIPVSGTAVGRSKVQIYDNGLLIGETNALANGTWAVSCQMNNPEDQSKHPIYAKVTTQTGLEMLSETQTVTYDASAIQVEAVTMYYNNPEVNGWRGQNYKLVYDFMNPSTTPHRYVYYIYNRTFTFTVDLTSNDTTKVRQVIVNVKTGDGKWHPLTTTFDKKKETWFATALFGNMYDGIIPVNVSVDYYVLMNDTLVAFSCPTSGYPDNDVPIDPSGYVYEAVPSNRLQGVTATCYYKETVEDIYGDKHENIVLWDAAEYAQENPLFTDEDGMYRWDVPQGLWQVKFEKEGYQTTYSDWLPVPPPQLDINIAMSQATAPEIIAVKAYEDGVEIEFDKYMQVESLTTDNIYVISDGQKVEGTIEFLNEESMDSDNEDAMKLASKVRFALTNGAEWDYENELRLIIGTGVTSYSGVPMQQEEAQDLDVQKKVKSIVSESQLTVLYEDTRTLKVGAKPSEAAAGKTLRVRVLSDLIAGVTAEGMSPIENGVGTIKLDANGEATLTISGELPGSTTLLFTIDDTNAEGKTQIKVEQAKSLNSASPYASRTPGSVYRGTLINLISDDENAKIWYTLDGSIPTVETALVYSKPIIINDDAVIIKAIAKVEGFEESEVATFEYTAKQCTQKLSLSEGWNWISYNGANNLAVEELTEKAIEVKSQSKGVIRDEKFGLFGNLSELAPTEAYKVKASESVNVSVSGDAFNATKEVISLAKGWNWIGYPMEQTMSVNEALSNLPAADGDIIVGLSGSAEFSDGLWIGDLEVLTPGLGYMYKSESAVDLLYNTSIVSKAAMLVRGRMNINNSPWSYDEHRYADVMPMRAQLFNYDSQIDADEFTVAAFYGTECRGIAKNVEGVLFMNIHGEGQENITFLAANNTTEEIKEIQENVTFRADNVGSFREPFALHLGADANGVQEQYSQVGVWPQKAVTEINVSLGGKPIDKLTLTGVDGKTVYISTTCATQQTINVSNLPLGIYIVAVQSGNEYFYKKVMKVNQ